MATQQAENQENNKKLVLAFSGGLDTSYCVKYLSEQGYEVHSVIVNTGGFSAEELDEIAAKARMLEVSDHKTIDQTDDFYQKCLRYLIYGNVLRNNTYPLSVSAERVFQAIAIVEYAKSIGAGFIAHGSTGAGNDQVRFDLIFSILAPEISIITPIRDQRLSRQEEVAYLQAKGVDVNWEKAKYSINKGLWGTSVGGEETLSSNKSLPEEAYPSQLKKEEPQSVKLKFEKGELKGIDDQEFSNPVDAILKLQTLAEPFAIGRDIHVGDTIIGIKGRVGFEAAAPVIIIKAHHLLEKHTLAKWQQYWKEQLANWYGMMLHEGQYLDPVMRDMEAFMEHSQERVSGTVEVKLLPYRFELIGIESPFDLMASKYGQYGEMNLAWSGTDVKGFTKILSNQNKIYQSFEHDND
ncbi:argininosuccinate synthase [Porifericola rhodea]|uniref:argininosuccinate synthase n=1 Tax=Porifericola rhodea TaxID=930972 RepID=UPI0026666D8C|nr:argininosuccinate synthase domain-containing protein [Porifericola rhodea]WKN31320.1 argininosuccinate synthase [Porifericola rhodea]